MHPNCPLSASWTLPLPVYPQCVLCTSWTIPRAQASVSHFVPIADIPPFDDTFGAPHGQAPCRGAPISLLIANNPLANAPALCPVDNAFAVAFLLVFVRIAVAPLACVHTQLRYAPRRCVLTVMPQTRASGMRA